MIYYMTPKVLPERHFRYGMFEVDNDNKLISTGYGNNLNEIVRDTITLPVQHIWNRYYNIDNFIANISKDCIVFTKESHPEYFI